MAAGIRELEPALNRLLALSLALHACSPKTLPETQETPSILTCNTQLYNRDDLLTQSSQVLIKKPQPSSWCAVKLVDDESTKIYLELYPQVISLFVLSGEFSQPFVSSASIPPDTDYLPVIALSWKTANITLRDYNPSTYLLDLDPMQSHHQQLRSP